MLDTKNNLLLFLISNNGCKSELIINTHTKIGNKIISDLIKNTLATTYFSQARHFKDRKEKWEYMKKKQPLLLEIEKHLL